MYEEEKNDWYLISMASPMYIALTRPEKQSRQHPLLGGFEGKANSNSTEPPLYGEQRRWLPPQHQPGYSPEI